MKVQAVIQARMGSKRLPGKSAMSFVAGTTFLGWVIERVRLSQTLDKIIVVTSLGAKDDVIEAISERHGVSCIRGSEEDVLMRFAEAIRLCPADVIVRATADNPLIDVSEMDRLIDVLVTESLDYAANHSAGLPLGAGAEAFTSEAFSRVRTANLDAYDRAHVTPYFYRHPALFRQRQVSPSEAHPFASRVRLTLDTPHDFQFLRALAQAMGFFKPSEQPSTAAILAFLQSRPEIVAINAGTIQQTLPGRDIEHQGVARGTRP